MSDDTTNETPIPYRTERTYLLREGHLLGFVMGLLLSRWWWAAVAWGATLMVLWSWSFRRADIGSSGDDQ